MAYGLIRVLLFDESQIPFPGKPHRVTLSILLHVLIVELPEWAFRVHELLILGCYADNCISIKGAVKDKQTAVNYTVSICSSALYPLNTSEWFSGTLQITQVLISGITDQPC